MTERQSAVVTGVSSGIGRAIAQALVNDGWRVFGSVRKESDAAAARDALGKNFHPLIFDVTDEDAIRRSAAIVKDELRGQTLSGLVNNAGVAMAGPIRYLPLDELRRQIDINLYGVMRVTQAFLPMLGADKAFHGAPGKIVNMSSVAGKNGAPFMGPYVMSKHALEGLSECLRRELLIHGIDVVIVGPGAISTPIWAKADEINADQYKGTEYFDLLIRMRDMMKEYGEAGLPPEAVGALVRKILTGQTRKTRHAILRNKLLMWTLPNLLPKRFVDKMIAKRFGFPARTSRN